MTVHARMTLLGVQLLLCAVNVGLVLVNAHRGDLVFAGISAAAALVCAVLAIVTASMLR